MDIVGKDKEVTKMTTINETAQTEEQQLETICKKLPSLLPGWKWSRKEGISHLITMTKGKKSFYLRVMYDSQRIEISGNYPRTNKDEYYTHRYGEAYPPEITVSINKTPKQIAGDITRRFFPEFEQHWAKVDDWRNENNAYYNQTATNLEALAKIVDKPLDNYDKERSEFFVRNDSNRVQVKVSGKHVYFEVQVEDLAKAKKVLRAIKKVLLES